jgi:hypothetical protein
MILGVMKSYAKNEGRTCNFADLKLLKQLKIDMPPIFRKSFEIQTAKYVLFHQSVKIQSDVVNQNAKPRDL